MTYKCPHDSCGLLFNFHQNNLGMNDGELLLVWRNPEIAGALSESLDTEE